MHYMFQDYITFQGHSIEVAYAFMLTDLEKLFCKSGSSLVKYGFPPAPAVPTELEEAYSIWINVNVMTQLEQLLQSLNESLPNNLEQQQASSHMQSRVWPMFLPSNYLFLHVSKVLYCHAQLCYSTLMNSFGFHLLCFLFLLPSISMYHIIAGVLL
jgi:hypothetical protein